MPDNEYPSLEELGFAGEPKSSAPTEYPSLDELGFAPAEDRLTVLKRGRAQRQKKIADFTQGQDVFSGSELGRGVARGSYGMVETGAGFLESISNLAGAKGAESFWKEVGDKYAGLRSAIPADIESVEEIRNAGDVASFAARSIGEIAPQIASMLIPGAIATKAAAASKAIGLTGRAKMIGAATAFVPAWIQETGGIYRGARDETGKDIDAISAQLLGAASGFLETVTPARLLGKMFAEGSDKLKKELWRDTIKKTIAETYKTGVTEGLTEAGQEAIALLGNRVADSTYDVVNKDNLWRVATAASMGVLGGGTIGGAFVPTQQLILRATGQGDEAVEAQQELDKVLERTVAVAKAARQRPATEIKIDKIEGLGIEYTDKDGKTVRQQFPMDKNVFSTANAAIRESGASNIKSYIIEGGKWVESKRDEKLIPKQEEKPITPPQTITGSNVQKGTEMPVQPQVKAQAGGGSPSLVVEPIPTSYAGSVLPPSLPVRVPPQAATQAENMAIAKALGGQLPPAPVSPAAPVSPVGEKPVTTEKAKKGGRNKAAAQTPAAPVLESNEDLQAQLDAQNAALDAGTPVKPSSKAKKLSVQEAINKDEPVVKKEKGKKKSKGELALEKNLSEPAVADYVAGVWKYIRSLVPVINKDNFVPKASEEDVIQTVQDDFARFIGDAVSKGGTVQSSDIDGLHEFINSWPVELQPKVGDPAYKLQSFFIVRKIKDRLGDKSKMVGTKEERKFVSLDQDNKSEVIGTGDVTEVAQRPYQKPVGGVVEKPVKAKKTSKKQENLKADPTVVFTTMMDAIVEASKVANDSNPNNGLDAEEREIVVAVVTEIEKENASTNEAVSAVARATGKPITVVMDAVTAFKRFKSDYWTKKPAEMEKVNQIIGEIGQEFTTDPNQIFSVGQREMMSDINPLLSPYLNTDLTTYDQVIEALLVMNPESAKNVEVLRAAGFPDIFSSYPMRIVPVIEGAVKPEPINLGNGVWLSPPGLSEGDLVAAISAYHGTPHKVDRFSTSKIGTGEGAQVYGWGLYFAENEQVAGEYAKNLGGRYYEENGVKKPLPLAINSAKHEAIALVAKMGYDGAIAEMRRINDGSSFDRAKLEVIEELKGKDVKYGTGSTYTVTLNVEPEDLLDWDKPLSEQSEKVKKGITKALERIGKITEGEPVFERDSGQKIYTMLVSELRDINKPAADQRFNDATAASEYAKRTFGNQDYRTPKWYVDIYRPDNKWAVFFESDRKNPQQASSRYLASLGIRGIRYLDQGSRGSNKWSSAIVERTRPETWVEPGVPEYVISSNGLQLGDTHSWPGNEDKLIKELEDFIVKKQKEFPVTYNYVIFNEEDITITHENGQEVKPSSLGGGVASVGGYQIQGQFIDDPNMRAILLAAQSKDPDVAIHEMLHFLEKLLTPEDRAQIERLRIATLDRVRRNIGDRAYARLRSGQMTANEFIQSGLPQQLYRLTNTREYMVAGMIDNLKGRPSVISSSILDKVKAWFGQLWSFIQGLFYNKSVGAGSWGPVGKVSSVWGPRIDPVPYGKSGLTIENTDLPTNYGHWIDPTGVMIRTDMGHEPTAIKIIQELLRVGKISQKEYESLNIPLNSTSEVEHVLYSRGWLRGVHSGPSLYYIESRKQLPTARQITALKNYGIERRADVEHAAGGANERVRTIYNHSGGVLSIGGGAQAAQTQHEDDAKFFLQVYERMKAGEFALTPENVAKAEAYRVGTSASLGFIPTIEKLETLRGDETGAGDPDKVNRLSQAQHTAAVGSFIDKFNSLSKRAKERLSGITQRMKQIANTNDRLGNDLFGQSLEDILSAIPDEFERNTVRDAFVTNVLDLKNDHKALEDKAKKDDEEFKAYALEKFGTASELVSIRSAAKASAEDVIKTFRDAVTAAKNNATNEALVQSINDRKLLLDKLESESLGKFMESAAAQFTEGELQSLKPYEIVARISTMIEEDRLKEPEQRRITGMTPELQKVALFVLREYADLTKAFEDIKLSQNKDNRAAADAVLGALVKDLQSGTAFTITQLLNKYGLDRVEQDIATRMIHAFNRGLKYRIERNRANHEALQALDEHLKSPALQEDYNFATQQLGYQASLMEQGPSKWSVTVFNPNNMSESIPIDSRTDAASADEYIARWQKVKGWMSDYISRPDADPIMKRGAERIMYGIDNHFYGSYATHPKYGKMIRSNIDLFNKIFIKMSGGKLAVPNYIQQFISGDLGNKLAVDLKNFSEAESRLQSVLERFGPMSRNIVNKAAKARNMEHWEFRDKISDPIFRTYQSPFWSKKVKVGDQLMGGYTVTELDMQAVDAQHKLHQEMLDVIAKLDENLISAKFSPVMIKDKQGEIQYLRKAVDYTGRMMSKHFKTNLFGMVESWKDADGVIQGASGRNGGERNESVIAAGIQQKKDILTKYWEEAMVGHVSEYQDTSYGIKTPFRKQYNQLYRDWMNGAETPKDYRTLVDQVYAKLQLEAKEDSHFEESMKSPEEVDAQIMSEFDSIFRSIGGMARKSSQMMAKRTGDTDKAVHEAPIIEIWDTENFLNNPRKANTTPSTFFTYSMATEDKEATVWKDIMDVYAQRYMNALIEVEEKLGSFIADTTKTIYQGESESSITKKTKALQQQGELFYNLNEAKELLGYITSEIESFRTYADTQYLHRDLVSNFISTTQNVLVTGLLSALPVVTRNLLGGPIARATYLTRVGNAKRLLLLDHLPLVGSSLNSVASAPLTGIDNTARVMQGVMEYMAGAVGLRMFGDEAESKFAAKTLKEDKWFWLPFGESLYNFLKDRARLRYQLQKAGIVQPHDIKYTIQNYISMAQSAGKLLTREQDTMDKFANIAYSVAGLGMETVFAPLKALPRWADQSINTAAMRMARNDMDRLGASAITGLADRESIGLKEFRLTPQEAFGRKSATEEELELLRGAYKNAGVFNLDGLLGEYVTEFRKQKALGNELTFSQWTIDTKPEAFESIVTETANETNRMTFATRPTLFKTGPWARFFSSLMGYPMWQNGQFSLLMAKYSKNRLKNATEAEVRAFGKVMSMFLGIMVMSLLAISPLLDLWYWLLYGEERQIGKLSPNKTTEENARAMMEQMLPLMPVIGSSFINALDVSKSNQGMIGNLLPISIFNSFNDMARKAYQSGDLSQPMIDFARQWMPNSRIILNKMESQEGVVNLRSVNRLLRANSPADLEARKVTGGTSGFKLSPYSDDFTRIVNAISSPGAPNLDVAREVYKSVVGKKADEIMKTDPTAPMRGYVSVMAEAEDSVYQSIMSRMPLNTVYGRKLSEGEFNRVMNNLSGLKGNDTGGRERVEEVMSGFRQFAQSVGRSDFELFKRPERSGAVMVPYAPRRRLRSTSRISRGRSSRGRRRSSRSRR